VLEYRAARADEGEKALGIDVLLQKLARRRLAVDVALLNVDGCFVQKTSGILACGSGWLRVKGWFGHRLRIIGDA